VRARISGHTYPSTIGTIDGVAKIPISGAVSAAANIGQRCSPVSRRCDAAQLDSEASWVVVGGGCQRGPVNAA